MLFLCSPALNPLVDYYKDMFKDKLNSTVCDELPKLLKDLDKQLSSQPSKMFISDGLFCPLNL